MYQPRAFVETDLAQLDALFAIDPFVTLVTHDEAGASFASHLPVLYLRDGERIHIEGHWARPNPQASHRPEALMIVHGPHAYVSPGWYPDKLGAGRVPTWNYLAVHCTVQATLIEEPAAKDALLKKLIGDHEPAYAVQWRSLGEEFAHKMLAGIVAFELAVTRVQCKIKLNQHRPESHAAMRQVYAGGGEDEQALGRWMDRLGMPRQAQEGGLS